MWPQIALSFMAGMAACAAGGLVWEWIRQHDDNSGRLWLATLFTIVGAVLLAIRIHLG